MSKSARRRERFGNPCCRRPIRRRIAHLQSANGVPAGQRLGRPSISVADFVNLTGERGDDYFARGLVQDITTALSEVSDYVVLSGSSPLEKNGPGDEPKTPGMLRARYVLSGSIQRSGDELRVNVQLVDAAGGHNVWAQKFDGHSENALEFQDRIAQSVVLAVILELQLTNWKVRDKSPPGRPRSAQVGERSSHEVFRNDPGLALDCDGTRREGACDSARQRACQADALHRNHDGPCLWCACLEAGACRACAAACGSRGTGSA